MYYSEFIRLLEALHKAKDVSASLIVLPLIRRMVEKQKWVIQASYELFNLNVHG